MLTGIDVQLAKLYAGARVSPALQRLVASRISTEIGLHKPSCIPEVLDFLGWASITAFVVCAVLLFVPVWAFRQFAAAIATPALIVAPVIAVSAAAWIGLRSYAELKH